jgi:hypothetical protein
MTNSSAANFLSLCLLAWGHKIFSKKGVNKCILKEENKKTLRLKPFEGDTTAFEATAPGYPYVFTLSKSMWKSSVLKSRKELLK